MGSPASTDNLLGEIRRRIEEILQKDGFESGSYPQFDVYSSTKPNEIRVKFKFPHTIPIQKMLAHIIQDIGTENKNGDGYSHMIMHSYIFSPSNWLLNLTHKEREDAGLAGEGTFRVSMYELDSANGFETVIEFAECEDFTLKELEVVASSLKRATGKTESSIWATKMMQSPFLKLGASVKRESNIRATKMVQFPFLDTINCASKGSSQRIVDELQGIGVKVFGYDKLPTDTVDISWDNIAGYEEQKREIEDTILLAMRCPEVYDSISQGTRTIFETSRPRAILFEGPPGTGKTSCARVIAKYGSVPLLNVPLEVVASKYYGEGENLLAKIFSLADELPDGTLIFLDEVDSLPIIRSGEMNEASRRILSVLLRQIDGFTTSKNRTVIATTNRKEDLDAALISRFDSIITFGLPDKEAREKILSQYAKHLNRSELSQLAIATLGMSGRDIKNVCQCAERSWASKIIRGVDNLKLGNLPHIKEYLRCAKVRRGVMNKVAVKENLSRDSQSMSKRKRSTFLSRFDELSLNAK